MARDPPESASVLRTPTRRPHHPRIRAPRDSPRSGLRGHPVAPDVGAVLEVVALDPDPVTIVPAGPAPVPFDVGLAFPPARNVGVAHALVDVDRRRRRVVPGPPDASNPTARHPGPSDPTRGDPVRRPWVHGPGEPHHCPCAVGVPPVGVDPPPAIAAPVAAVPGPPVPRVGMTVAHMARMRTGRAVVIVATTRRRVPTGFCIRVVGAGPLPRVAKRNGVSGRRTMRADSVRGPPGRPARHRGGRVRTARGRGRNAGGRGAVEPGCERRSVAGALRVVGTRSTPCSSAVLREVFAPV